jgi:hypothetical protein
LRAVEQQGNNEAGTDSSHEIGDLVEAGEVFAHERRSGHTASDVDEVQLALADLDRLPPKLLRIEGTGQVVLADLTLVETPPVVLVLLDTTPAGRTPACVRRRRRSSSAPNHPSK